MSHARKHEAFHLGTSFLRGMTRHQPGIRRSHVLFNI